MSSLLSTELAATCNSLGYYDRDDNKYYADSNTLETAKDLIRFLRRDDESHDIRRQLGDTKVIQSDLLPLLKNYWEQTDLFDVLLRLLVNLTTPALMLWKEEVPKDRSAYKNYLQVEEHLQFYKAAFADETIWAVLSTRLSKILEIDYLERGDENSLIIERILILIRNILYVPSDAEAERRPDNDANIHDQVLWALHQSGMLDIVLYITSSTAEVAYYMHILEVLSFMLREQNATELASAALQRSQLEKKRDEEELLALRSRETNHKIAKVKKYNGTRHSQFGGTFVVKSMQSISDANELIYHKPLNKVDSLDFDGDKRRFKTPKNRAPMKETNSVERRSAFSIRLFLKEFCIEFLNGSYNTMMHHVKGNLVRAKAQQHDESYYLWALRFFMEFNRNHKCEMKLVSETMSIDTFHYVQSQMTAYFDSIASEKANKPNCIGWARRLHTALLSYRELLQTIAAMDKAADGSVRDSSAVIKSNLFYMSDYREFVLTLLFNFNDVTMSGKYLKDLLETQHIFTRMLEAFCGGKDGNVVVENKKKARRKAAAKKKNGGKGKEFDANSLWDECYPEISAALDSYTECPDGVIPFDATSSVPIDEQKVNAMKNIQRKLRRGDYEHAIGLLRVSRDVWPENDCFGSRNSTKEEEFLALREIFLTDIGEDKHPEEPEEALGDALNDGPDEEEDEEDELAANMYISESNFKFDDFVKRLVHSNVIKACGSALKKFDKNSAFTNHCIVKLLHRVAVDCKMPAMVFQVSIFQSFQKIFDMNDLPQFKELQTFAKFILRQFVKVATKNEHVYAEALFWKKKTIAYEIEEGYGTLQNEKKNFNIWDDASEDELRRLFMEHQEQKLEEDVVDYVWRNIIDSSKTRRSVLMKLKDMYLLTDDYKGPKKVGTGRNRPWDEAEEEQLRELYERCKDDADPLGYIISGLERDRPKNRIIEKMLVMGLIEDRKQLRKKRGKKSNKSDGGSGPDIFDDDDASLSSGHDDFTDDDSSNVPSTSSAGAVQRPTKAKVNIKHTTKNRTSKPTKSKKTKLASSTSVSRQDLSRMLIQLVDSGMSDALEWIRDSFGDALEDLEADDNADDDQDEGVPLVPLMEHSITAMDNAAFLTTIRAMHVHEPADEQENFWRISSKVTAVKLRGYCDLIQQAIDKTLVVEETALEVNSGVATAEFSDSLEQLRKTCHADVARSIMSSDSEDNENEMEGRKSPILPRWNEKKNKTRKVKTRIQQFVDSDDDSNQDKLVEQNDDDNTEKFTANSHNTILNSSDNSDDESDAERDISLKSKVLLKRHKCKSQTESRQNKLIRSCSETTFKNAGKSSKRFIASDSDETDKENQSSICQTKSKQKVTASKSRIQELINSDNDSNDALNRDCDYLLNNLNGISENIGFSQKEEHVTQAHDNAESKRIREHSGSDSDTPRPKRLRIIDSDAED